MRILEESNKKLFKDKSQRRNCLRTSLKEEKSAKRQMEKVMSLIEVLQEMNISYSFIRESYLINIPGNFS